MTAVYLRNSSKTNFQQLKATEVEKSIDNNDGKYLDLHDDDVAVWNILSWRLQSANPPAPAHLPRIRIPRLLLVGSGRACRLIWTVWK